MDNQNTCGGPSSQNPYPVLILVLMDNQNTKIEVPVEVRDTIVLILVLMDNQNTLWRSLCLKRRCLNPCSNG